MAIRQDPPQTPSAPTSFDAVIVGAGFAGMYMLHRLRQQGLAVKVFETGDGVGGTWHWNTYPGARVDVESTAYSYGFDPEMEQEWHWSRHYAYQDELQRYADHVADRFDLRRDIQFNAHVTAATYDEQQRVWDIEVTTPEPIRVSAKYLVSAVGCLSATNVPDFEGLDDFAGEWFHTARWPASGVDLEGKRVGIIGTGSTGIQVIPIVAKHAEQLYVFQRTANYSLPCDDRVMDPEYEREWKSKAHEHRVAALSSRFGTDVGPDPVLSALEVSDEERARIYEEAWPKGAFAFRQTFKDLSSDLAANETAAEFVRSKIHQIVEDPETAELLAPTDHPFGSKRICMDTGYYQTFNRPNVELVDVRTNPIVRITPEGLETTAGHHNFDVLILATGFDAMTGPLLRMNITGRGGETLADRWSAGPVTYLGLAVPGFPNLFTITGPGSPSVLSNMITAIEQHVDWITDAIAYEESQGLVAMEPSEDAARSWTEHVDEVSKSTLFRHANSWYLGANIPGKPRVFMPYIGGFGAYRQTCDDVAEAGYEGFLRETPSAV